MAREITPEEESSRLARHVLSSALYWADVEIDDLRAGDDGVRFTRLAGLCHTVCAGLDGSAMALPGMGVMPGGRADGPGMGGPAYLDLSGHAGAMDGLAGRMLGSFPLPGESDFPDDGERSLVMFMEDWAERCLSAADEDVPDGVFLTASAKVLLFLMARPGAGLLIWPGPHKEDMEFCRSNGENWSRQVPEGHPATAADAGGFMRYSAHDYVQAAKRGVCPELRAARERASLSEEVRASRPGPARPGV